MALLASTSHPKADPPPQAGNAEAYGAGVIAASGFSGTKLQGQGVAPGVDPVTKTILDPDGITLRIYGAGTLSGPMAGQLVSPPVVLQFKARDVGHVFGLAFDNEPADATSTPGLYAAATSAFGLNITAPGKDGGGQPDRLKKGAPGAKFAEGQFGPGADAGPGTIWKIDRATGSVSLFANLNVGGAKNSGAGIGALAFDPVSRTLYASDLDTGLIHRFSVAQKADLGQFDHGVTGRPLRNKPAVADDGERLNIESPNFDPSKPQSWGLTQIERRVEALAVHEGRLYYSVSEGPEIWSVGIGKDGNFQQDVRFEAGIESEEPFPVTSIVFDNDGQMIVAQRGPRQNPADYVRFVQAGPSQVLRLKPETPDDPKTPGLWLQSEPQEYAAGEEKDYRAALGGLTLQYAYREDGTIDPSSCSGTLVFSTDAIGPQRAGHGLQFSQVGAVRPANAPPVASAFIDINPQLDDVAARGYAGGVAALQTCSGGGFPPVAAGGADAGGGFPPVGGEDNAGAFPPVAGDDAGEGGPAFPPVDEAADGGGAAGGEDGAGGGGQAGGITIAKVGAVDKCSPKGGCAFNVEVKNDGAADVPGPITIDENIEAPQAALTGEPNAPWTCTKAAPFKCTHPGPVPANGKLDMRVVFAPNVAADTKEIKNCAALGGGGLPKPQNKAALPLPPAPAGSNNGGLKVDMVPVNPKCSPKVGDCKFKLTITNNTGAEIKDQPLKTFSTLASGTESQAKNAMTDVEKPGEMQCKPEGREFNCVQEKVTLAPGQSTTLNVGYSVDTADGGPAAFVQNTTVVTLGQFSGKAAAAVAFNELVNVLPEPGAPAGDAQAGDAAAAPQQACATIPLDPNAPVQNGPIVVTKKATSKCPPNGPCTFSITVQNTTDADIKGPIVVEEKFLVVSAEMTAEAPWQCSKKVPFVCSHQGPLPARSKLDLNVSFAPNLPPQKLQIQNCAVLKQPAPPAAPPAPPAAPAPAPAPPPAQKNGFNLFQGNSLIQPASFGGAKLGASRFQSRDPGLLHLAGGADGCKSWKWTGQSNGFSVLQSKGITTSFVELNKSADGRVFGRARYPSGQGTMWGNVTGTFTGTHFEFDVRWDNGQSNHYSGDISSSGQPIGSTVNSSGANETFLGLKDHPHFACETTAACEAYAQAAVADVAAISGEQCAPANSPDARWSNDKQKHIEFCMSHANQAALQAENKARLDTRTQCASDRTKTCDDYAQRAINAGEMGASIPCGFTGPRWSSNKPDHVNWCLAQVRQPNNLIAAEANARASEIAQCADCHAEASFEAEVNASLIRRNCDGVIPDLTEAKANAICRGDPKGRAARAQATTAKRDACDAKVPPGGAAAAGAPPAGGAAQPAGGAGGAAGGAKPAANAGAGDPGELAAEQCAVVQMEEEQQPDDKVAGKKDGAPQDQGNGLTIQKSAAVASCTAGQACSFNIKVTSKTPGAPGKIVVVDMPDNPAELGIEGNADVGAPAPWKCEKNLPIRCEHPGPVPAGGLTLPLSLKTGDKTAAKLVRNCASIDTKPGPQDKDLAPEPSCAEVPLGAIQPPPPANTLSLAKNPIASKCSTVGGGCDYVISVSNPAGAPEFNGSLTFTDHVSQPNGEAFPNVTMRDAITVADEGVIETIGCKKDGNDVTCTSPNTKIPPGKGLRVNLSFKPGEGTAATAIKNCASLPGGEKQCANIPLVDGPLLRAVKSTASNTCVPNCSFGIVITNVGRDATQNGRIIWNDVLTGANANADISVIDGDFNCQKVNGTLTCVSKTDVVLKPGDFLAARVIISNKTISPEYRNCVEIVDTPGRTPDNEFPGRCVTIKEANPNRPLMTLFKAVKDLSCTVNGPCRFEIIISNFGPQYTGPIEFIDEVPEIGVGGKAQAQPAGVENFADADWDCQKLDPRHLKCKFKKPAIGASGANVTLPVLVTPGPGWKKNDTLLNCATLIVADGTIGNGERHCANYSLDPFAVSVKKTGDSACAPGSDCKFQIALFNPGPIDHNAPVTISDKLTGISSAQILSINPPLPCAAQPTQIPFSCTSPGNFPLPLGPNGEPLPPKTFDMVVRLPNDVSAAQFSNCASVAPDTGAAPAEESCVTVSTKPVAAQAPAREALIEKTAQAASCDETTPCPFQVIVRNPFDTAMPGPITLYDTPRIGAQPSTQVKVVNGPAAPWTCIASAAPGMQCSHPGPLAPGASLVMAYALQPLSGSIGTATELKNCAALQGYREGRNTACATIALKAATPSTAGQCIGGMVLTNGICACPEGRRWNGRDCGEGGFNTTKPGDEQPKPAAPVVVPIPVPVPLPVHSGGGCGLGMVLVNDLCACPPPTKFNGRKCAGGDGGANTSKQSGDEPVPPPASRPSRQRPEPPQCPQSRPIGEYPDCCPVGTEFRNGRCRPPRGTGSGGTNGTKPSEETRPERCSGVRPVGEWPNCCPVGTEFRNGRCRPPRGTEGSGGTNGTKPSDEKPTKEPPKCSGIRPVGEWPNCCPAGTEFRRGVCRPPRKMDDGRGNGGTNGTQPGKTTEPPPHCPRSRPIGNWPNCCPLGTEFRNGSCQSTRKTDDNKGSGGSNGTKPQNDGGKCPTWAPEGRPPNCHCPAGTVRRGNFCGVATCGANMTGTPPNCHRICPSGTVNRNESCVPVPKPTPPPDKVGPAPKPVPQQPKCLGDKKLIDGVCRCPSSAPKDIGNNRCDSASTR